MPAYPKQFERTLGALRKALVGFLLFVLLPWLFVSQIPPAFHRPDDPDDPDGGIRIQIPRFEPVPADYPAAVRYAEIPLEAMRKWIRNHYPGSLVDDEMLGQIRLAARQADVSVPLLLGILGAEQSFLDPDRVAGGWFHAITFAQNPFDYGVWPGSPYQFDIGPYKSALGAAVLTARMIEAFPPGEWGPATYRRFFGSFYELYVRGEPALTSAWSSWSRNVFTFWSAISESSVRDWAGQYASQQSIFAKAWNGIKAFIVQAVLKLLQLPAETLRLPVEILQKAKGSVQSRLVQTGVPAATAAVMAAILVGVGAAGAAAA